MMQTCITSTWPLSFAKYLHVNGEEGREAVSSACRVQHALDTLEKAAKSIVETLHSQQISVVPMMANKGYAKVLLPELERRVEATSGDFNSDKSGCRWHSAAGLSRAYVYMYYNRLRGSESKLTDNAEHDACSHQPRRGKGNAHIAYLATLDAESVNPRSSRKDT